MKPIYVTIPVEQELPAIKEASYVVIADNRSTIVVYFNGTRFERAEYESKVTHWLKPITSLSDLPEEWKEKIRSIAGDAFDSGAFMPDGSQSATFNRLKQEHLKTIL